MVNRYSTNSLPVRAVDPSLANGKPTNGLLFSRRSASSSEKRRCWVDSELSSFCPIVLTIHVLFCEVTRESTTQHSRLGWFTVIGASDILQTNTSEPQRQGRISGRLVDCPNFRLSHKRLGIEQDAVGRLNTAGRTEMARRPSRIMCGTAKNRVNRTPSGLPLCSTCHVELGFCSHREIITDPQTGSAAMRVAAATAAAGGGVGTMNKTSTSQSRESAALVDFLQQGTKRRRSAAQNIPLEKGKRRELLAQPRVKVRVVLWRVGNGRALPAESQMTFGIHAAKGLCPQHHFAKEENNIYSSACVCSSH